MSFSILSSHALFLVTCIEIMTFFPFAVPGGVVSQIQGSYEYHHYLQDGFDDSVIIFSFVVFVLRFGFFPGSKKPLN